MLHHVLSQIVAYRIGVPLGRVQKTLNPLRVRLADGFSQLPTVLALHPPEQAEQVALHSLSGFRTGKAPGDTPVQFF
jgi:hypothetical protein